MTGVEIRSVAAGGSGVGRLADGMVVFVPRTAPGDRVSVDIVSRRKSWATGRVRELLHGSSQRVEPRCAHFVADRCGGCQLQHVTIEAQRDIKSMIVGDALRRIARWDGADPSVEPSTSNWRYRRKVTLHRDAEGHIGFHPYDDAMRVFDLDDCSIADERLMTLWRAVAEHKDLLPRECDRIVLSIGRDGYRHIIVSTSAPWTATMFFPALGLEDVCVWRKRGKTPVERVAGPETGLSPSSFEQANEDMADRIRRRVVDAVAGDGTGVAWDLYGGFGDTARLLANRGWKVWTVDIDPEVREWAKHQQTDGDIYWVAAPAENAVAKLPEPEVVIVNPPRTGLPARLCDTLNRWGHQTPGVRLGYISCDPATLARDVARMPAFRVTSVSAYDLFPQTSHVEVALTFASGPVR